MTSPHSSSRLRSDLLHKLGIGRLNETPSVREPSRGSLLGPVKIRYEPLKHDDEPPQSIIPEDGMLRTLGAILAASPSLDDTHYISSPRKETLHGDHADKKSKHLSFNDVVVVIPIPRKEEYSKRIRNHLWSSQKELEANAYRNTIEFLAEGWDWRSVTEEQDMYRCETGEMIHPIHFQTPSTMNEIYDQ